MRNTKTKNTREADFYREIRRWRGHHRLPEFILRTGACPGEDETLNLTPQKVNVDFPSWVVAALDRESDRLGVARQSLIKVWIVERLEHAR